MSGSEPQGRPLAGSAWGVGGFFQGMGENLDG